VSFDAPDSGLDFVVEINTQAASLAFIVSNRIL